MQKHHHEQKHTVNYVRIIKTTAAAKRKKQKRRERANERRAREKIRRAVRIQTHTSNQKHYTYV